MLLAFHFVVVVFLRSLSWGNFRNLSDDSVFKKYFPVAIPNQTLVECAMKCRKTSTTYLLFNENKKHCILVDDEQLDSLQTTAGYSWNEGDSKGKKRAIKSCVMLHLHKCFGLKTGSK